jgi:cytochrome bd-type quinol oxidase subunit 2
MKQKIILLSCGIVLTILFVIFSTQLYEQMYYEREFSNEMYNYHIYSVVAMLTAGIAWAVASIYYYIINSVSFSRWYHWMIMLVMTCIIVTFACYTYTTKVFSANDFDFKAQAFAFSLIDNVVATVIFIISSFSIRWWSQNCRHTPIPE